ncbi:MAG: enoyl-CoA hydratase [Bacteroidetes bacterium]|nr:MAG: enoyl-CoA hydratase [Bacteroidota bacterium]
MNNLTTVITTLEAGIFVITINRPEKLNALNAEVIRELGLAIAEVYTNDNIAAAIVTGAGPKAFVAGADIAEFTSLDGSSGKNLAQLGQQLVFNKIEQCPKPIVAAVNGFALGGGCELAMACHFRYASTNAKFGQPEVNLGLVPGYGGTQRLTQLVGKGRALELMMTGNIISADEALAMGLVNKVCPSEGLMEAVKATLNTIAGKAPLAVAKVIDLVNTACYHPAKGLQMEIDAFGALFESDDLKEGASAFLEKRKPNFKGR